MTKLRRPQEKLGGCVWLPRFIDKCRLHRAGDLPADYRIPFGSSRGIDGAFLDHFALTKEEFLSVVAAADNDAAVVAWLETRGALRLERVAAWNELAPHLGQAGHPGEKAFAWARRHLYAACTDPRVDSGFTAIAWDEGFLDEVAPPLTPRSETDSGRA